MLNSMSMSVNTIYAWDCQTKQHNPAAEAFNQTCLSQQAVTGIPWLATIDVTLKKCRTANRRSTQFSQCHQLHYPSTAPNRSVIPDWAAVHPGMPAWQSINSELPAAV